MQQCEVAPRVAGPEAHDLAGHRLAHADPCQQTAEIAKAVGLDRVERLGGREPDIERQGLERLADEHVLVFEVGQQRGVALQSGSRTSSSAMISASAIPMTRV